MREPRPDDLLPGDFHDDEFSRRAVLLDLLQRLLPDEVVFLIEVDQPSQACLVWVVIQVDVGGIVQDARLDPTVFGGAGGPKVEPLAGSHHALPKISAPASVAQVDLVSDFGGPAGPRHEDRDSIDLRVEEMIVREIQDAWTGEGTEKILRFWSLDLHRGDVGFLDLDIEVGVVCDAFGPEEHVAVRGREPEPVFLEAGEDRVVDDAALLIRQHDVLRLADLAGAQIPRRQAFYELVADGALDLDPSFASDVPYADFIQAVPLLFHGFPELARDG